LDLVQAHAGDFARQLGEIIAIVREQRQLSGVVLVRLKSLDRAHPAGVLRIVQFAEIQRLALHDAAAIDAFVFHHAPVAVKFSIFLARLCP